MGCVGKVLNNPVTQIVSDVAAVATGNPELIPLINAGERTAGGIASGESFGKAFGQGAISGAEALGGQELAGAVGIGEGNSAFNNALGITGDNPAGTGLPDIGGFASRQFGGVSDALGFSSSGTATPVAGTSAAGGALDASGQPLTASPSAGGSIAPSSGSVVNAGNAINLGQQATDALLSPGDISGATTGGTPGLGSIANTSTGSGLTGEFASAAGGSPTLSSDAFSAISLPSSAGPAAAPPSGGLLKTAGETAIKSALPLGALAYQAISGPGKLPSGSQALQPGGQATAPLLALEKQGATEATTGQLTPPQKANIQQFVQGAQNKLIQQLSSEGVTNIQGDSRFLSGMQDIQQQALALQQQYITAAINEATQAGGAASGNIATVAGQQIQQDQAFQQALAEATGALGGSIGGSLQMKAA